MRIEKLIEKYARLRIAVVGDFCLDRYLDIDPTRSEVSIETGRAVHNVVRVRSLPGAAGTIVNNLVALGVGAIHVVGFTGLDGEGYELRRALALLPGVRLEHLQETNRRATFTYCKPLLLHADRPPEELERLDQKNWTPTPADLQACFVRALETLVPHVDALIVMDQVDVAETGVVTVRLLAALADLAQQRPTLPILADSRRGLRDYPPLTWKMNRVELAVLMGGTKLDGPAVQQAATTLAEKNGQPVFVTLSEDGILAAQPDGVIVQEPAVPVRGPIDIVGAGDAVTANLAAALASGATVRQAVLRANAAAHVVVHQLGTTGTAPLRQIQELLGDGAEW